MERQKGPPGGTHVTGVSKAGRAPDQASSFPIRCRSGGKCSLSVFHTRWGNMSS